MESSQHGATAGHSSGSWTDGRDVAAASSSEASVACRIERVFPIRIRRSQDRPTLSADQKSILPSGASTQDSATITSPVLPASQNLVDRTVDSLAPPPLSHIVPGTPLVKASPTDLSEELFDSTKRYVTKRFDYLSGGQDDDTPQHAVGHNIYRCEDEPIHIPGAIQGFGVLIALRENKDGQFVAHIVSENSQSVTGLSPHALFELSCFKDVMSADDKQEFGVRVQDILADGFRTSPDVFKISLVTRLGAPLKLYCAMHLNKESDLIICEFELEQDTFNVTHPPDDGLLEKLIHAPDSGASDADRLLSTTIRSTPLRAVKLARNRSRRLGSTDLFQILFEIQAQLAAAVTLAELLDIVVGLVYELSGFNRVMVYQFDEAAAGSVVSEIVDPRASTDIYRGLNFPSSDIPKQARELYLINTIRVLYDREQETSRLVCRSLDDAKSPLDLTHSYLRAMSPIHMKYLGNMGVRSSMSISLVVGGKLWGLISCHSYGESGLRVSLPVRELCRGLGNIASTNIEKLLYLSRLVARKPLSMVPPKTSPSVYIAASSAELLNMFGADFGFLVIKGEARTIGKLSAYTESVAVLQYIRQQSFTSIFTSQCIAKDCQDISYTPGFSVIAGMLVVPLTPSGADFLVFFRKGKLKQTTWAGNPHEKLVRPGSHYLEPRSSFQRWSESVIGTSKEWTEDQIDSAAILSNLYGRFIDVWRQKEAIVQKNRLTRLLIKNAGHEVRTPLNSIINYLEVALEEDLNEQARDDLQRSLQASKSLVFVVNDLLNLTEVEDTVFSVHEDNVDLRSMISDVITAFRREALRRDLTVILEADTSRTWAVRCDPTGLRQVVSNILSNAIKHSQGGLVRLRMKHIDAIEGSSLIEIVFEDEGSGLSERQLNDIFQDFEQILDDEKSPMVKLHEDGETTPKASLEIGLGLAVTARFVRLNNGQISMSSEGEGKGTRVSIRFPFREPLEGRFRNRKSWTEGISLPTPPGDSLTLNTPMESINTYPADYVKPDAEAFSPAMASSTSPPMEANSRSRYPFPPIDADQHRHTFKILVAEDNPLNSRILETRLTKKGHKVQIAMNGQGCIDAFESSPASFDIILMDIQMPLVDGIKATRHIRAFEKEHSPAVSQRLEPYGRIPIIAVSASLVEQAQQEYVDIGFDGWILKPVEFKRLEEILSATEDEQKRKQMLYGKQNWERGGWFRLSGKTS